jgi:hypothetical protein
MVAQELKLPRDGFGNVARTWQSAINRLICSLIVESEIGQQLD